jgi:acylphosphatase
MDMMICRRLSISGRVQGVFYRDWFVEQAQSLGVTGWVRNRAGGSVEAMVSGSPEMIDAIVARARQGSPASRVDDVVIEHAPEQVFEGFEQCPTL